MRSSGHELGEALFDAITETSEGCRKDLMKALNEYKKRNLRWMRYQTPLCKELFNAIEEADRFVADMNQPDTVDANWVPGRK